MAVALKPKNAAMRRERKFSKTTFKWKISSKWRWGNVPIKLILIFICPLFFSVLFACFWRFVVMTEMLNVDQLYLVFSCASWTSTDRDKKSGSVRGKCYRNSLSSRRNSFLPFSKSPSSFKNCLFQFSLCCRRLSSFSVSSSGNQKTTINSTQNKHDKVWKSCLSSLEVLRVFFRLSFSRTEIELVQHFGHIYGIGKSKMKVFMFIFSLFCVLCGKTQEIYNWNS